LLVKFHVTWPMRNKPFSFLGPFLAPFGIDHELHRNRFTLNSTWTDWVCC
jgi:hypothetical protein